MSIYQIPFGSVPDLRTTQTFENQTSYDIRVRWNTREEAWYCYIGYAGKDPVCKFKLTTGTNNLIKQYKHLDGCPKGKLVIWDAIKTYGRPDYDSVGVDQRFQLIYIETDTYIGDTLVPVD